MAQFLVELYVSRIGGVAAAEGSARRARRAVEELTREGRPVRYLRSIFVPEDEICFFLFEAGSAEDIEEAARRASLSVDRAAVAIAGGAEEEES